MKRLLIALVGAAAVAATGSLAWATIPDAGGAIHACVKEGGAVRLLDTDVGDACKTKETETSWNVSGPSGPAGPSGPPGQQGPPGPGVKTISGLVWIDGTVSLGSGFSASKSSSGDYVLMFPPGTWKSFPVIVVSPFGLPGAFPVAEVGSSFSPGDGSLTAHILTSSTAGTWTPLDVAFWFVATAS